MAVYVYEPGRRSAVRAESIRMSGASKRDIERERHELINAGMNAVLRGEAHTREIAGQLAKADLRRLPVELMSRLLDPEHYPAPIINFMSGLAMYAPREEGTPNFALLSEEVEEVDELVADGRMDPDTFEHLTLKDAITHDALQLEPVDYGEGLEKQRGVRAHNSFGYEAGGAYLPIVTVLNSEHPVVQLIRG